MGTRKLPSEGGVAIPTTFEKNVGQADARSQFIGHSGRLTILATRSDIAFVLAARGAQSSENHIVRLGFLGGRRLRWRGEFAARATTSSDETHAIGIRTCRTSLNCVRKARFPV